jgi:hypothetical protein
MMPDPEWKFLITQHLLDVDTRLPKVAKAFRERVDRDVVDQLGAFHDRRARITAGSRTIAPFQREELTAEHRRIKQHLAKVRQDTVDNIAAQERVLREREAAKRARPDPTDETARELRRARLERRADKLRSLDPMDLRTRLTAYDGPRVVDDLEAIAFADADGWPIPATTSDAIAPVIEQVRAAMAERGNPEIAALADLRHAYDYALNVAGQVLRAAARQDAVDVWDISDATIRSTNQPASLKGAAS